MGSPIETWEGASAYFTGAGGFTPGLILLLAAGFCLAAIIYGGIHEAESYRNCEPE